ncbi:MAG: mechanosensitive ion channel domain-containing protein [Sedimenticola sp.]
MQVFSRPNPWLFLILILAFSVIGAPVNAQNSEIDDTTLGDAQKQVAEIEKAFEQKSPGLDLEATWKSLTQFRQLAKSCTIEQNKELERLTNALTELGESAQGEDKTVSDTRREMVKKKQATDLTLASCKLLNVKSEALLEELTKRREMILKERLLTRYPNLITLLFGEEQEPVDWKSLLHPIQVGDLGFSKLGKMEWGFMLLLTLAGIAVALVLRRLSRQYQSRHQAPEDFTGSLLISVMRTVQRYGLPLSLFTAWSIFWMAVSWQQGVIFPLLSLNLVLLGSFIVLTLGRAFFAPLPPAAHYLPQPETECRRFWNGLRLLTVVVTGILLVNLLPITSGLSTPLESAARLAFATLIVFSLSWVIWDALLLYGRRGLHMARFLLLFALAVSLIAEFIGYRNLSEYLIGGIFLSLFLVGIAWLLSMLFSDFCDSLDEGRYTWEGRFRKWLGVGPKGYLPGVFWLRMLGGLFLWGGSALILLRIWDVSAARRAELLAYVTEGFTIGEIAVKPARIIIALGILVILMSLISWSKKQLDERWLKKSRMDAGARNAVASVTAYAAAAIAIVITLGFAGVELSNLAIIAGALSVGIGFGLQNIVNNFVSGLILLFERPVQKGDWIVVGNTEGYVRKISIRSTQIQTFDRADVMVPNSELISAQVTNWMLRDLRGRVRAPIGVAYGSDVEKVKEILLDIAHRQPGAILDGSVNMPKVLFLGFGDSALNFELRFIIRNVDEKLQTLSDVNFAIDKAFRENDISIPFPQRDLHLRSSPIDFPSESSD